MILLSTFFVFRIFVRCHNFFESLRKKEEKIKDKSKVDTNLFCIALAVLYA